MNGVRDSIAYRRGTFLALLAASASALALAISLVATAAPAGATVPEKTDIMFIFDTSGSMGGVLTEAKEEIKKVIQETEGKVPNAEFGVANVEDLPGYEDGILGETKSEEEYANDAEKPWHLWQALTSEQSKVEEAIDNLSEGEVAHSGGDGPEAYGRALWETDTNPQVGWRAGARHEIVLIADNVPHAPDVNEGIPSELQFTEPNTDGFETWPNTGEEPGGMWGIPDTQWKAGDSLEFHKTLEKLSLDGKPLAMVNYFHTNESAGEDYVHYWEYWADQTGGQALEAQEGKSEFASKLIEIVEKTTGNPLPPCPTGYEPRTGEGACVSVPPPPPPPPAPPVLKTAPSTSPPKTIVVVIDEEGEIEEEVEFPEAGEAEFSGEVDEGAEAARFRGFQGLWVNPPSRQPGQPMALAAKKGKSKNKKCRKGYVKKGKRCVNNASIPYGRVRVAIPAAGRYKLKLKPSAKALAALKKGRSLNVKLTLKFTPAGTTTTLLSTKFVRVHLKPKPKKHHKHKHKK